MPTLYRVDAVLSFAVPVDAADLERLVADLTLPSPASVDGREDAAAHDVRVDEDGTGADLVGAVEAAVVDALARSGRGEGEARLDSLRSSAAYDL